MKWVIAVCWVLAAVPVYGGPPGQRRDVLLVEHPGRLTVLNHYEQTASAEDRNILQPFAPIVVVNEHATLSDGFTSCVEVQCGGVPFYLLNDSRGGLPQDAGVRIVRGASWIGDTMRVSGASALPVENASGSRTRIAPGALVERFFEERGRIYVHPLATIDLYGWMERGQQGLLGRLKDAVRPAGGADTSIEAIVRAKLDETNAVLRQLYQLFNGQTGRRLTVPQWTISIRPGLLRCALHDSRVSYEQSTRYLDNDMENALLGTGARLVESPGSIAVYLP